MMRITDRIMHKALIFIMLSIASFSWSHEEVGSGLKSNLTTIYDKQVNIVKSQYFLMSRKDMMSDNVQILYFKSFICMLNAMQGEFDKVDIKTGRKILSAPESASDLQVQRKIFAISQTVRIILNEVTTPFGDPVELNELTQIANDKIEKRLKELEGHGIWQGQPN